MIEAGLVCHWSGLGPSPAWGAASRVSPNPAPLLPRTGGPIATTPALRRNPRQRRSSALPRALLISLSEREMKAASPAPKVNVHNLSIMIGLPFVPEGPRQFPSASNAPIAHRRNCRRGYHRSTGQRRTMPARRLMASAGLSTPRLDIREPITRLTERLQSMGGLRHRVANPVGSGGGARKQYLPSHDQDDAGPRPPASPRAAHRPRRLADTCDWRRDLDRHRPYQHR